MTSLIEQTKPKHSILAPESSYWRFLFVPDNASVAFLDSSYPNHVPTRKEFEELVSRVESFYDWIELEEGGIESFNARLRNQYEQERIENRKNSGRTPNPGYVYLMQAEDIYKIGRSNSPERRLQEITKATAKHVTLLHIIPTDDPEYLESQLHERFSGKRINGEWFSLSSEEVSAIKAIMK